MVLIMMFDCSDNAVNATRPYTGYHLCGLTLHQWGGKPLQHAFPPNVSEGNRVTAVLHLPEYEFPPSPIMSLFCAVLNREAEIIAQLPSP